MTMVFGLTIAISSLIAYFYFSHKIENLVLKIEDVTSRLHTMFKKLNLK
jgi:biopolymer transport protein ExbB/TolQ